MPFPFMAAASFAAPMLGSALGGLFGGGGGKKDFQPSMTPQQVLGLMNQGPTGQQQQMVSQLQQMLFQQGAQGLQQQAQKLSASLSGSAAARGLGASSIGLGQQGLLGQEFARQLGGLQTGLQSQGLQQLLQFPMMRAQLGAQMFGSEQARASGLEQIRAQQPSPFAPFMGGLGQIGGMALGRHMGIFGGGAGGGTQSTQQPDYGKAMQMMAMFSGMR